MNPEFRTTLAKVLGKKPKKGPALYRAVKDGDLISPIQLDEFLEGVGGILRLPPKNPAPPPVPKTAFTFRLPTRWLVYVLPVVAMALVALSMRGSEDPGATLGTLPASITGRWITADRRYQNRSFEITLSDIVFKNGDRPDDQTAHPIASVRVGMRADTTMLTIEYVEAGDSYELALKYVTHPKPAIIFVNQEEMVWHQAGATAAGVR